VIEKTGIGHSSSDFSAGARDIAKSKAAETREGPVDLRSAEQIASEAKMKNLSQSPRRHRGPQKRIVFGV
jgi:hypothetical protein